MLLDPTLGGAWVPFAILAARIIDVALGVMRNIYATAGMHWQAAAAGFFEILLWVFAVAGVVSALDDPFTILAFAGGYGIGTFVGIWIEERIALGYRVLRIMNTHDDVDLGTLLRAQGYGVTQLPGRGFGGPVEVVLAVIPRRRYNEVVEYLDVHVPDAFYTIERVDRPHGGTLRRGNGMRGALGMLRK
ncbi:MAG: DUF5698 domain-containing protein [Dehalococcoidia bacterium]